MTDNEKSTDHKNSEREDSTAPSCVEKPTHLKQTGRHMHTTSSNKTRERSRAVARRTPEKACSARPSRPLLHAHDKHISTTTKEPHRDTMQSFPVRSGRTNAIQKRNGDRSHRSVGKESCGEEPFCDSDEYRPQTRDNTRTLPRAATCHAPQRQARWNGQRPDGVGEVQEKWTLCTPPRRPEQRRWGSTSPPPP